MPNKGRDQRVQAFLSMALSKKGKGPSLHFLFDSNEGFLVKRGVFVCISVLPHSPFSQEHGATQLVSFLASLVHPSLILVGDLIQQHMIMSLRRRDQRKLSIEEARHIAVERGNLYVEAIHNAMKENKDVIGTKNIAVVRWEDMFDENKERQESILQHHYLSNRIFQERVDMVAMDFLNSRTPKSRSMSQRKKHSVNYLLSEIGLFISGFRYKGERYNTLVYATSSKTWAQTKANLGSTLWKLLYDILTEPKFRKLKQELVEADEGIEADHGWPILSFE